MPRKPEAAWPPLQQILSVDHAVCVSNLTDSPILLNSGEQLCQVHHVIRVEASTPTTPTTTHHPASPSLATCRPLSCHVILHPDGCLDQDTRDKLIAVHLEMMYSTPPSLNTVVQAEKLRLL